MEDAEIIELYFRRSEEAIAESDRKYGAYCSSIAWRILKSREDSEECVSDTWLRAWGAMPPARPRFLRAFFGKITRNLSLGRYERDHAAKRGGGEVSIALDELGESPIHRRNFLVKYHAQKAAAATGKMRGAK